MPSVTVYSTQSCPYCVKVKNFLKSNDVDFVDIDVGSDHQKAQEMVQKSGQMGVPVVEIDGQIIVGFDQQRIKSALGISEQ